MYIEPKFLKGRKGAIFSLFRSPGFSAPTVTSHCLIIVPPFADEMNKSRHMFSVLSRKACDEGCSTLIFDPFGAGESEGDFIDARWNVWLSDLELCVNWAKTKGCVSFSFLGMRTGALLAAEYVSNSSLDVKNLILWAPVKSGKSYLKYFYRLDLVGGRKQSKVMAHDNHIMGSKYIAGYELAGELVSQLQEKVLSSLLHKISTPIHVVNIKAINPVKKEEGDSPANIVNHLIVGPPFWLANDICEIPELIDLTIKKVIQ